MNMESNKYLSQIDMDLYCFKYIHHRFPEKIFMSYPLWNVISCKDGVLISRDVNLYFYRNIHVQLYRSDKMEYYFALSGFVFEEE